jgi:hypothetical protein
LVYIYTVYSPDQLSRSIPAVKLRNVTYRPPEPAKETMTKQNHDISSDSNTDINTPRLPTQVDSNKQLFQKVIDKKKHRQKQYVSFRSKGRPNYSPITTNTIATSL